MFVCYHFSMKFEAELAQFKPDPALAAWLNAHFEQSQKDRSQLVHLQHEIAQRDVEISQAQHEIAQRDLQISQRDATIKAAEFKIQALTFELAHHRRIRFGHKSEALSSAQLALFEENWHSDQAAIEAELEQQADLLAPQRQKRTRKNAGRQTLPEHLPRIDIRHEPACCDCTQCGQALIKIREDISEKLDVEPARFTVQRHIRPQYACRACQTVSAAPIPAAIIDGGLATPGLHAWVIIQKYQDHLPLYRIEQISSRYGVTIPRSTLADWIGRHGVALQPLAERLGERLKQQRILHADETPVAQLAPGTGKTQRATLWAYRSNTLDTGPPIIVFDYQSSRSGQHARDLLGAWRGELMVDGYAGYKALFQNGITELACLAHARRKFFDLHAANQSPIAAEALRRIAELYAIEAQGRDLDAPARHALRQQQAKPLFDDLQHWLTHTRLNTAPGSATAKAIDYSLKRWPALARYLEDGLRPIDNNPVENCIRPIAIGKKNWLFAGSERAGQRAAAIQSLLGTAKLNDIEPYAWLKDTLEKLPTWPNRRIDELLPLRQSSR